MIPELSDSKEEIEQIFELSKQWLSEVGRHAVLLVNPDGNLKCTPLSLSVVRKEPSLSNSELQRMLEKYDTNSQIVVYGNESNRYCALTLLGDESLKRATGIGGMRWVRKLLRLGSSRRMSIS